MQLSTGGVLCSPTDLVAFLGCQHATVLDLRQLSEPPAARSFSETDQLLAQKGQEHEAAFLQSLKQAGKAIREIPKGLSSDERIALTDQAMQAGADVVYQAALAGGRWAGFADFLIKTATPSHLGSFSYEALDTKLARHPDAKHLIQLGVYSDLIAARQGLAPELAHLVLGDGSQHSFRVRDFAAYVRHAQQRLEQFVQAPPADSYPEPCAHCAHCHWHDRCTQQWVDDDHLSLVANMHRGQADKLKHAGIKSLTVLAQTPAGSRVPELNPDAFDRLRAQAALQFHKRTTGENKYELIAADEGRGFARLPQPDQGDLFFDMEGDPLYPDGLEYLFGLCLLQGDTLGFKAFWAHDHAQEKDAFGAFMAFLHTHLAAHPDAYIYHYNHYETTALKRLASRHGVAEHQLDDLLRRRKFVDLYRVVREAIRVSEPSYSLKNLETFYMAKRDGQVASAGESIVVYNRWRLSQDPNLLNDIAAYNEFDCRSTAGLRDWLISLRPEGTSWLTTADPGASESDPAKAEIRLEREQRYGDYQRRLLATATEEDKIHRQHLADLLGFHDREAKPQWWEFFARQQRFEDELLDDMECLAGLELTKPPEPVRQSLAHTYRFPPQDTKLRAGDQVVNVATLAYAGTIERLDEPKSLVTIKVSKKTVHFPPRLSVGPKGPIDSGVLREALYRVARSLLDGVDQYPAVRDILGKVPSRILGRAPGEPLAPGNDPLNAIAEAAAGLDQSYLFIQGPPGAGKTYTSAHVIVELIRRGKRIGVASNSHKAIHNLLDKVEDLATRHGVKFQGIKKCSGDESAYDGTYIRSEADKNKISLDVELLAGTAWLFADERFDRHLDYLFIDEAGQVSVANVVAMGTSCTKHCPRRRSDAARPAHPGRPPRGGPAFRARLLARRSGHRPAGPRRLPEQDLAPPAGGLPVYFGHVLRRAARTRSGECRPPADFFGARWTASRPAGVQFHAVEHSGCSQKCEAEGRVVQDYYQRLLTQQFRDKNAPARPMTTNDILVVSPYNMQVNYLRSVLPDGARVGTVDKFQGQEAPVVLVSMATSGADYLPRDIEFLFSANRLNVAISRAQCLAVVVASPKLLATPCRTIEQLYLVNNFCRLAEYSVGAGSGCDSDSNAS